MFIIESNIAKGLHGEGAQKNLSTLIYDFDVNGLRYSQNTKLFTTNEINLIFATSFLLAPLPFFRKESKRKQFVGCVLVRLFSDIAQKVFVKVQTQFWVWAIGCFKKFVRFFSFKLRIYFNNKMNKHIIHSSVLHQLQPFPIFVAADVNLVLKITLFWLTLMNRPIFQNL